MPGLVIAAAALSALLLAAPSVAVPHAPPRKVRVAEGVYVFMTEPYGDVGLDGNSVVVLSPDGVLVFDSNGTPAAAAAVLAEIRAMTDAPVRYLVHSHWHWDHWYGAEVYRQAFPGLVVITQEKTRQLMAGPALDFNRPGLEQQLPAYIASLERRVAAAAAAAKDPPPPELPALRHLLDEDRAFLDQKRSVHHVLATLTFNDELDLYLGGRRIQVLHYDRAVTPGDAFLYLPAEKVLVTGDLLVNPITFALGSYPSGWLRTLERLDALDASVIVPGHGPPLHDEQLLHDTMAVFRELLRQGRERRDAGDGPDEAKAAILPTLAALRSRITGGDLKEEQGFDVMLVDWFLHRVFDELRGPLGDEIAPIPES